MPVILMMTEQGEGDRFRFVDDGRPRAGAENYTTYGPGRWPEEFDDEAAKYREPGSQGAPRQGAAAMLAQGSNYSGPEWYPRADTNPSVRAEAAQAQADPYAENRAFLDSIRQKARAANAAPGGAAPGGARSWSQDLQSPAPSAPRSFRWDENPYYQPSPTTAYQGTRARAYLPYVADTYNPQAHAEFRGSLAGDPELDQAYMPSGGQVYLPAMRSRWQEYPGMGQVGVNSVSRYTGEQQWAPAGSDWGDAYAMQERGAQPADWSRVNNAVEGIASGQFAPGRSAIGGAVTADRMRGPYEYIAPISVTVPPYQAPKPVTIVQADGTVLSRDPITGEWR